MKSEGSVEAARLHFLKYRPSNLDVLLRERYCWMNRYLHKGQTIVEIGAGSGLSPLYLSFKPILTDANDNPWIDKIIDATDMNLESGSVDILIASHNIHHFYSPYKFFLECGRVLKNNGLVLIQEINTSLMMRVLLRIMRHEGWSYNVNVFDEKSVVNDKADLWSANCAVPEMLFGNKTEFEKAFPDLFIERNELCECLIFPMSGGVISKINLPRWPLFLMNFIISLDKFLIKVAPNVFALGRRVVIQKRVLD